MVFWLAGLGWVTVDGADCIGLGWYWVGLAGIFGTTNRSVLDAVEKRCLCICARREVSVLLCILSSSLLSIHSLNQLYYFFLEVYGRWKVKKWKECMHVCVSSI